MEVFGVNWLDIIIVIILGFSTFMGFKQGFVTGLLSLIGIIVGVVLASNFYEPLGNVLGFINNEAAANIFAFIIIVGLVMALMAILAGLIKALLNAIMLGWIDHIGGGVFGFVMSFLSISALLAIIVKYTNASFITDSALAGFLLDTFPVIMGLLPSEFDIIRNFFK
jgi:membrane protein required for colicin V production